MVAKKATPKENSAVSLKGRTVKKALEQGKESDEAKTKEGDSKVIKSIPKRIVPNVIYIGHLPEHCEERELIGFLKQFGILTQLRLCRSHKTGGSKGYAFAKFQDPEVATIVAGTLNGYLLSQKKLVSHVLAPEQIHQKLFNSKTRTVFQRQAAKRDGPKSLEKMEEISRRLVEREEKKREKLTAMGMDYDFPGYSTSKALLEESQKPEVDNVVPEEPIAEKASAKKKRKHSDDEKMQSPVSADAPAERTQSEKKKKKKKDKKRRKSAP